MAVARQLCVCGAWAVKRELNLIIQFILIHISNFAYISCTKNEHLQTNARHNLVCFSFKYCTLYILATLVTVPSVVGGISARSGLADLWERLHWSRAMDACRAMDRRRRAAILTYGKLERTLKNAGRFIRPSPSLLVTLKIKTYEKGSFKTVRGQRVWEITAELWDQ